MSKLGKYGEGQDIHKVLNGTLIPPEGTSEATNDLLTVCKKVKGATVKQLDTVLRYKETVHSWKIRKEKTSTYNHHIVHYTSVMKYNFLSWFYFQRGKIPVLSGYSQHRHRTCADLTILKQSMDYELKTQRTIGILDT